MSDNFDLRFLFSYSFYRSIFSLFHHRISSKKRNIYHSYSDESFLFVLPF